MRLFLKFFSYFVVFTFLVTCLSGNIYSQSVTPSETPTPTPDQTSKVNELNKKIGELEGKLKETQAQGNSLSSEIKSMDNNIMLTQYKISATQSEIASLGKDISTATKKISNLEHALSNITKVLLNRVVATYQAGTIPSIKMIVSADDFSNYISRESYLKIVQAHDKKLIYDTQQAKNDYENQKEIFEGKKVKVEALNAQLQTYKTKLDQDKKAKEQLLAVTKNDEARYQKLLAEARAQISGFKTFASVQGGSVLPPQPSPDGWYYNQRDERWGRMRIGASPEAMWEVGCLVTATTMLRKQRGENITPGDVASQTSFYFSNTAMMLIPWNGGKFTSRGKDMGAIDSKLSSGTPVIVGLNAGPYGTHFIVLKSGSNGDYIMNDPWYGPDLKFTSYYSVGQIFQYGYLN